MFDEKMKDTEDEVNITGTPNATTPNYNDRTPKSISPAAIHDLTTKQILTPRVLDDRNNKLNSQHSTKSDGSRKLSFSEVDAPVFGSGHFPGIISDNDEDSGENDENKLLQRKDSLANIFFNEESNDAQNFIHKFN